MPNLTTVTLTNGLPTAGSGTVSTIDNMPNLTLNTQVVNGANTAAVKGSSAAPSAADPALVVAISPNGVNPNGRAVPSNSAPVVLASQKYQSIAASQTGQKMTGTASGASGDWLDGILIVPGSTSPGAISIADGTGSAIMIFTGGAGSVTNLIPFYTPIGAVSAAGAWSMTSGSSVTAIVFGNFT